ncbi:MAG: ABC transporter permease [Eubacteriaceae bacterium]|nr:ABC transporter permease [Eubacteriaceae bacterium]
MFKTLKKIISDHIEYKTQILRLAKVDKDRAFKGSDLGWVWALFKPAMRIAVYYFAMVVGFRASKSMTGIHCSYFLWLVAGLVPWFYMSGMITGGAMCFRKYRGMIQKTAFPKNTIPTIVTLSNFKIHIVVFACMLIMFPIMGYMPSIYWVQLPVYVILMLVFTYFWSLATGLLSIVSEDFLNVLRTLSAAVFWMSAILFDKGSIENPIAVAFFRLNPVTFIVYGYRNSLCYHQWIFEDMTSLIYFLSVMLVMIVVSTKLYSGLRKQLPDIV